MKILYGLLVILVLSMAVSAAPDKGLALSASDARSMAQKSPAYASALASLNSAIKTLEAAKPDDLQAILDDQRRWERTWQDSLVTSIITAHGRGEAVPASVLANNKVDRTLAYTRVTAERAHIMNELARQAQSPTYGVSLSGKLGMARHAMMGGMFTVTPEGWWTSVTICFFWEKDNLNPHSQGELRLPAGSPIVVRGRLRSPGGFLADTNLTVSGQ